MTLRRVRFGKESVENIPTPTKGYRNYVADTHAAGLVACRTAKGRISFYTRKYLREEQSTIYIKIGRYPEVSIQTAREINEENCRLISKGKNPNKELKKKQEEITLGDLWNFLYEHYYKVECKAHRDTKYVFDLHLKPLARRRISSITKAQVAGLKIQIGKNRGPVAANKTIALISAMYNRAGDYGYHLTNPAHGVRKFKTQSRSRFLQPEEMPKFLKAVRNLKSEDARDIILMLLFTGARKSNLYSMRWKDVDLENATWLIPDTKNGTPHFLPISDEALKILKKREQTSKWVFPNPTSKTGYILDIKKSWATALTKAEIEDLRMHDLRRTLGSWEAATGANISVIGKTLNHKSIQSTAVYARLHIGPVREAVNKAVGAMVDEGVLNEDG